jgi:hypothetical protein
MTNSGWEFSCKEWLELLQKEIENVTMVNEIGHKINQTILGNDKLSKDSDLWRYLDNSFLHHVTNLLWRIIEKKSCEKYKKTDANFDKFLVTLRQNQSCILSKNQFANIYDNFMPKDFLKILLNERKDEYEKLLNNQSLDEMIGADLETIKSLRNKIEDFRHTKISHLKTPEAINNIDYNLKYGDITDSILCLQELIAKYMSLITRISINFNLPYHYGNVFDIPWNSKEQEKV